MNKTEIVNRWYIRYECGCLSLIKSRSKLQGDEYIVSIYEEENDGYRFMNRGREVKYGVLLKSETVIESIDDIIKLLQKEPKLLSIFEKIASDGIKINHEYVFS